MQQEKDPTFEEFLAWSGDQVAPYVRDQVVDFSPGGSSRWYFYHYGDPAKGYDEQEIFVDYARRSLIRTVEIVDLMFRDGIRTVFVVAVMPGQFTRNEAYSGNLARVLNFIADEDAETLYKQFNMGVGFRGKWDAAFNQLGIPDSWRQFQELEARTTQRHDNWIIWLTQEDAIPGSLAPFIQSYLESEGGLPDQATLARAYYNRDLDHVDIFIGHNKPSLANQIPPLLTVGDVYFTTTPCYDIDHHKWRMILYDHLFSRKGQYRDYTKMDAAAIEDYRQYYDANKDVVLGVGTRHDATQTWRPIIPPSLR